MSFEFPTYYTTELHRFRNQNNAGDEGRRFGMFITSSRFYLLGGCNTRLFLQHKLTGRIKVSEYPRLYPLVRTAYDRTVEK